MKTKKMEKEEDEQNEDQRREKEKTRKEGQHLAVATSQNVKNEVWTFLESHCRKVDGVDERINKLTEKTINT